MKPQKPQDRAGQKFWDPRGRQEVLSGIQMFSALSSRYHLAPAVLEGAPPCCRPTRAL